MLKKLSIYLFICATFCYGTAYAELAIISHAGYKSGSLNTNGIKKIFLGKRSSFPDGSKAVPINHAVGSPDRKLFLSSVLKMAENHYFRHWTRMRSTGGGSSPDEISNYNDILREVASTPGSISYIDASLVNDSVKVLLTIDDFKNI